MREAGRHPPFRILANMRRARQPEDPELKWLRRLNAPDVSLEEAYFQFNAAWRRDRAADSTVMALVYQLRRGGIGLDEPGARRRLRELSEQQLHEASTRLQKFTPDVARAWTAAEVESLVELWSQLHG